MYVCWNVEIKTTLFLKKKMKKIPYRHDKEKEEMEAHTKIQTASSLIFFERHTGIPFCHFVCVCAMNEEVKKFLVCCSFRMNLHFLGIKNTVTCLISIKKICQNILKEKIQHVDCLT